MAPPPQGSWPGGPPPSSRSLDYGALYQPSETELINEKAIFETAGFASVTKCMKHSRRLLITMRNGHPLFEYLDAGPDIQSRIHLPDGVRSTMLDDEFEEANGDLRQTILHPAPPNISSERRRELLNGASLHAAPRRREQEFVRELRVIGWILQSIRNMRLAWLMRTKPLPLHYVRLIRREDFEWIEPLLPMKDRLTIEMASLQRFHRRNAGSPIFPGFVPPLPALSHTSEGTSDNGSSSRTSPRRLSYRMSSLHGSSNATITTPTAHPALPQQVTRPPAAAVEDDFDEPPSWKELAAGTEGGDEILHQFSSSGPPAWQMVARQERRQRHLLTLERRSTSLSAARLLDQLRRYRADTRERLFHIYDHRVLLMDTRLRQRLAHKYLSIQTAQCTPTALKKGRAEVAKRVKADMPTVVPARWYRLLQKRATDIACGPAVMDELECILDPFITNELSTFNSAAERLCLLVMSLPVYELMTPHWQSALMFVLVEIVQHHEGLLHAWLNARKYPDYILHPMP